MKYVNKLPMLFASAMLLACSSSSDPIDNGGGSPDAMSNTASVDAAPQGAVDAAAERQTIPRWTLEDVQTDSAMLGQIYGLDNFADKILVVVVVQGF